jgi:hypothetical protein
VAFSARRVIFGILGIPWHSGTPLYGRAKIPDLGDDQVYFDDDF